MKRVPDINPYAPPGSPSVVDSDNSTAKRREFREPQSWSTPEILRRAWRTYRAHWQPLTGVVLMQLVAALAVHAGIKKIVGLLTFAPALKALLEKAAPFVLGSFVDSLFAPGIALLMLAALRNEDVRLGAFLFKRMSLWPACFAVFLVTRAVNLADSTLLKLVVDISFGFAFELPIFFMVDANVGLIGALRGTARILGRAIGKITWASVICGVLVMAGIPACGVGYLVASSVWYLALGTIYLREAGSDDAEVLSSVSV